MSELSVNDQLEGILSDFEALKRSFDIEDVESPDSAVSVPVSPSSSHFFLNHDKASEGRRVGQSPSLAFSNNNNNLATATHHSHIGLGSNPSPVPKSRTLISSLSFNQGSMSKPAIHNHGSSVIRAASFQGKLNPNGYSTWTGQGSDNDSLHSSTSSLEYSGGGGATPLTKHGLQSSHSAQEVYQRTRSQFPQHLKKDVDLEINPIPRKFYSYGTVFHSEMNEGTGTRSCVQELRAKNNGFLPSLELQFHDGGGGMVSVQSGRGGDRVSSALRCTDATVNLNDHISNASFFGEEAYCGSKNDCKQQEPRNIKFPQSRTKETPRLNKFPLDLNSLVSTSSNASSIEAQRESVRPQHPKNLSRSKGGSKHQTSPPSTSVSPSASLSSLDSSSDTPPFSLHYPFLPFSSCSPTPSQGPILPETCYSPLAHFTAQIPQQEIPTGPQVVEDNISDAQDSVGSIIQRIASFSQPVITDAIPTVATPFPAAQSKSPTKWNEGMMKQSEIAEELVTGLLSSMEDRQDGEKCIAEKKPGQDDDTQGQPAVLKTEKFCKDENYVHAQMEKGKDKDEDDLKKEMQLEADVKVELWPSVPGLQMNFIHGTDLFGYVGIEAVLDQIRNKTMKAGFEFNIMVVGQSGLGKSTLVNTLFKSKVSRKSCTPNYEERIFKTVKLQTISHVIEEKGVKMKLTVIDTPGFGDQINNKDCWEPIVKYINEQYEKYLKEELHVNRKRRIPDTRVHCCIYFLPATGHRLRPIDIEFMKRLGKIVSIVPVIAKADTLTIGERQEFKERIRQDIAANGISVYPQKENDEDPEECILNDRIREKIPFAVVGTDKEHQVNGNKVLGRKTKWGIIEVENVAHCEFANLRDLLIRSHLQDLKDVTHNIHYETYRVRRLNESNVNFSELGLPTWLLENGNADKSEAESHL